MDEEALRLYMIGDIKKAVRKVTEFIVHAGGMMQAHWLHFYGALFVKFRFYLVMSHEEDNAGCGCTKNYQLFS